MASAEEEEECTSITWEIENFILLLAAEEGKRLCSPVWKVEFTEGSAWWRLHARHSDSRIVFDLEWLQGLFPLSLYNMSLVFSGGEIPLDRITAGFFHVDRDAVFGEKRQSILPNDTLTLRCRMWEKTIRNREFRICSVLHGLNYLWNIEEYCSSDYYDTCIEQDNFLLYGSLNNRSEKGTHVVTVEQLPCVESCLSFVDYALFIKDGRGRVTKKTCMFPNVKLKFDVEILSENNKSINLQLESIVAHHKGCQNDLKLNFLPQIVKQENSSEAFSGSSGALNDDLLLLYRESALSDATLNTEGKSFSAHRSILAARSPVFRAMFEKDEMSEGRSGVVDIDDVDSETVDRMLVFLYGDSLEGVQWENALALYYAADKYAVLSLKQKCADLLMAGLTVDKVCDALVLADKHSDQKLMKYVVDFIRGHQEVFSSSEWEKLEENIPRLTTKIFRDIYVRKKECK